MKPGDLVYPWSHKGDHTAVLYIGREFYDWKNELHGSFFWNGQCYIIAISQLKLVHAS